MLDPTFRKEMDSVEYRQSGKSILNQIADVISRIIKSSSPNAVKIQLLNVHLMLYWNY